MRLRIRDSTSYSSGGPNSYADAKLDPALIEDILSDPESFQSNDVGGNLIQHLDKTVERSELNRQLNPQEANESIAELMKKLEQLGITPTDSSLEQSHIDRDELYDYLDQLKEQYQQCQQGQSSQQGQMSQQGQSSQQGQMSQQGQSGQQGQMSQQGQSSQQGQMSQQGQSGSGAGYINGAVPQFFKPNENSTNSNGRYTNSINGPLAINPNHIERQAAELERIVMQEIYEKVSSFKRITDNDDIKAVMQQVFDKYSQAINELNKLGAQYKAISDMEEEASAFQQGSFQISVSKLADIVGRNVADKIRRDLGGEQGQISDLVHGASLSRMDLMRTAQNAAMHSPTKLEIYDEDLANYTLEDNFYLWLLIDRTGSMNDKKMVAAKKVGLGVKKYFEDQGDEVRVASFDSYGIDEVNESEIVFLYGRGSTPLHHAIDFVLKEDQKRNIYDKKIIAIVSDGEPDNQTAAEISAKNAASKDYKLIYFYIPSRNRGTYELGNIKNVLIAGKSADNLIEISENDIDNAATIVAKGIKNAN